jgi:hypothetical protein
VLGRAGQSWRIGRTVSRRAFGESEKFVLAVNIADQAACHVIAAGDDDLCIEDQVRNRRDSAAKSLSESASWSRRHAARAAGWWLAQPPCVGERAGCMRR